MRSARRSGRSHRCRSPLSRRVFGAFFFPLLAEHERGARRLRPDEQRLLTFRCSHLITPAPVLIERRGTAESVKGETLFPARSVAAGPPEQILTPRRLGA